MLFHILLNYAVSNILIRLCSGL